MKKIEKHARQILIRPPRYISPTHVPCRAVIEFELIYSFYSRFIMLKITLENQVQVAVDTRRIIS